MTKKPKKRLENDAKYENERRRKILVHLIDYYESELVIIGRAIAKWKSQLKELEGKDG